MSFDEPEQELSQFRRRVLVAGAFVMLCFVVLAARFAWLQVSRFDYYHTRAEDNRIALVPIVPNRGLITDRNGVVLARNYAAYTLEITLEPQERGRNDRCAGRDRRYPAKG